MTKNIEKGGVVKRGERERERGKKERSRESGKRRRCQKLAPKVWGGGCECWGVAIPQI